MINRFLLGLLIAFLSFIGFSNATFQLFQVGVNKYQSNWNSQYNVGILKNSRFLSDYLGTSKSLIALNDNYLIWWSWEGGLYSYWNNISQGYFQYLQSCDEILNTGNVLQNCTSSQNISYLNNEFVSNFVLSLKSDDWVYIEDGYSRRSCGGYCNYDYYTLRVCFSSSSLSKTMCFVADKSSYESSSSYNSKTPLVGSLGYTNLSFANVSRSDLSDPPFFKSTIEGSSSISNNVQLTGNLVYNTCTNGYVVSQLRSIYGGTDVCYAGTYNTGLVGTGTTGNMGFVFGSTGYNFKEIYNLTKDWRSWSEWFKEFGGEMYKYQIGQVNVNPFQSRPIALYSYFKILYDNGVIYPGNDVEVYNILNYCKLALYSDYDKQYNGSYFQDYCNSFNYNNGSSDILTGEVGSVDNDDEEVLPPGFDIGGGDNNGSNTSSGSIVSVDWSGTLSGDTNQNFDGKTFINDFYQKLQSNYQKPLNGLVGIVPTYILVFMCALILFRFLQH